MHRGSNYINGCWLQIPEVLTGESTFQTIDPSTEDVYGIFPNTLRPEVAVQAARKAFPAWRSTSRIHRADLFDKLAQLIKRDQKELAATISLETGKSLNESNAEVIESLHMTQYVAGSGRMPVGEVMASELATKDAYVLRKPKGVVIVISPWNFPLAIGSFWCSGPALLEGNTVVHKPSELTPLVNEMAARLYHEAGFPPGVFNLVHGDGGTGYKLVSNKNVDAILFTGSAEVGQLIRQECAAEFTKTCSIECGSKSAMMIFEDGDLDLGVDCALNSAFKLSGQRCVSSGRILVQRSILEAFEKKFVEAVERRVIVTLPKETFTDVLTYGPLISQEHYEKVSDFNTQARVDKDVTVLFDPDAKIQGYMSKREYKGYFMKPFVYRCEWADKPFLKNEVFGPHVAIIPFDDINDAIRIYNDTDYGLSLGVVTDDFRKHRQLTQECTTGMLYINGTSIGAESHMPFSSWKKSGYGASASATWKAVTHPMAVTVNYERGKVQLAQGLT